LQQADEIAGLKARVRDLETTLHQNDNSFAHTFQLSPVLNNLFGLLMSLKNVPPTTIRQRLEIASDPKVAVHRLRQRLKPYGIAVSGRRNLGYWLSDDMKTRVTSMVTPTEAAPQAREPALA
jgi:hypothetical protein